MKIIPVQPEPDTGSDTTAAGTTRRTFGKRLPPSRRTFGRKLPPSRRTFGRQLPPSRRTFGRKLP